MKVVEIFDSIEGEGFRQGLPVTFIRLGGCNLRCPYCDTKYSWHDDGTWKDMSIEEIVKQVHFPNITITGGEPLIQDGIVSLIRTLVEDQGCSINVETNGTVWVRDFHSLLDFAARGFGVDAPVYYTIDYKCPSSGMEDKMERFNFLPDWAWEKNHCIYKFVVANYYDLQRAYEVCRDRLYTFMIPQVFISPVYGKIELEDIVNFMMDPDHREVTQHWRLQTQLHKIIWNPNKRGV